jgi:homopolymeric O-antigen transport system ATP-binding protein
MTASPTISMEGVSKRYGDSYVVRDVDLTVAAGECVAIVGHNGAGKSTMLKQLSGVMRPTSGSITVKGRLSALIEVSAGFHQDLTGRENIFLNGVILGMSRAEVKRKFDQIVEFSGVERHVDTPVKWYSSGMYVRLAFAVAAHLEPEILIVDEVLAVGDAEFQKRCLGRMGEVAQAGRTVLFVSHNMQAVRRLCDRGIFLERGAVVADGDVETIVRSYLASIEAPDSGRRRWDEPADRPGDELCRVVEVRVTDDEGKPAGSFFSRRPIHVVLDIDIGAIDPAFVAGFDLATTDGVVVFRSYTTDVAEDAGPRLVPGRNAIQCTIPPGLLNTGRYALHLRISLHWTRWIVHLDDVLWFDVIADHGESLFLNDQTRPGVVAPILDWSVAEPAGDVDEPAPAQISS